MQFEPYIEVAARRYNEMLRAYHERGPGKVGEEHKRYRNAIEAAYRQSGLELMHVDHEGRVVDRPDPDGYSEHGPDVARDRVRLRVLGCAVELLMKESLSS